MQIQYKLFVTNTKQTSNTNTNKPFYVKENGIDRHQKCVELIQKPSFKKYIHKYNTNTKQTSDTIRYKEIFLCERERGRQTPEVCAASQNFISEIQIQIQTQIRAQIQNYFQK